MRAWFLALAFTSVLAAPAIAADEVKVRVGADGKRTYVVAPVLVRGKPHRPEALLFMTRAKFTYEWPELRREPPPPADPDGATNR
jgi:hypothetical protein